MAEAARPSERAMTVQRARFDRSQIVCKGRRQQEALGRRVPISLYRSSACQIPEALPRPSCAGHMEVRCPSKDGNIPLKNRQFIISQGLAHEYVRLELVADWVWSSYSEDCLLEPVYSTKELLRSFRAWPLGE